MRLFNELKGKFTKTVEEKLNEIKSEKKQRTLEEKRKIVRSVSHGVSLNLDAN
jgi:hypothetical protein